MGTSFVIKGAIEGHKTNSTFSETPTMGCKVFNKSAEAAAIASISIALEYRLSGEMGLKFLRSPRCKCNVECTVVESNFHVCVKLYRVL